MNRFPTTAPALGFALAAGLLLGGTAGYAVRPATTVSGPTRVVYVQPAPAGTMDKSEITWGGCTFANHHKTC